MGRESRDTRRWGALSVAMAIVVVLGASQWTCANGATTGSVASSGNSVLTIGSCSGPFPQRPNPVTTQGSIVYEPLMLPNVYTGAQSPWLASSYKWSNGGKALDLTLRSGVKWSDGTAFTASDVAFTFDMIKKYPALNIGALPISSAKAGNNVTATVDFSAPAYGYFPSIVNTLIVPKHIWAQVGNPITALNVSSVGTGPYVLQSFTPQVETFRRNTHYWGGLPNIATVRHVAETSRASCVSGLEAGTIDWSNVLLTSADQKAVQAQRPGIKFSQVPTALSPLVPNLTKYPLNQLAVRQAISDALNRTAITQVGAHGFYVPALSPTGLNLTNDASAIAPQYRNLKYSNGSSSKAKTDLEQAGFKMGSNGIYDSPNGQPLNIQLLLPSTFVNFLSAAQVMISELHDAGISMSIITASQSAWTQDVSLGNFDMTLYLINYTTPYQLYNIYLNTSDYQPIGKAAVGDYGRLQSSVPSRLLQQYGSNPPTSKASQDALTGLETFEVQQLPIIPVFFNIDMGNYDTAKFSGWPTGAKPYADPAPLKWWEEVDLMHLKPKKAGGA